jgi:hypothetical protein
MHKQNAIFVKYVYVPTDCIASETHLAEGLALKLRGTEKVEKSLMDLEGMRKLTESKMEGQAMLQHQDASSSRGEEGSLICLKCLHIQMYLCC